MIETKDMIYHQLFYKGNASAEFQLKGDYSRGKPKPSTMKEYEKEDSVLVGHKLIYLSS